MAHHAALLIAYSTAFVAVIGIARALPQLWPAPEPAPFTRPWREVGWAMLAAGVVILIGMLYARGWLLPATSRHRPLLDAINQLLIYAPFPLLLVFLRQSSETAWLPRRNMPLRVAIGLALGLVSLAAYAVTTGSDWPMLVGQVYRPAHVSYLVQVLLEDIAIAILFVRWQQGLGLRGTLLLVATLFAAAHIPGLLSQGATARGLVPLFADVGLAVLALSVLHRLRDVWWFWMVHFALDMTQFSAAHAAG